MEESLLLPIAVAAVLIAIVAVSLFVLARKKDWQGAVEPVSNTYLYVGIASFALSAVLYYGGLRFLFRFIPFESTPSNQWIPFLLLVTPAAIGITCLRAFFWSRHWAKQ